VALNTITHNTANYSVFFSFIIKGHLRPWSYGSWTYTYMFILSTVTSHYIIKLTNQWLTLLI